MQLNYLNFINIHNTTKEDLAKINYDFNTYFAIFLNNIGCNPYYIRSICNTIFSAMTSDKVYYHTPVHILSIIDFGQKNFIKLENWEILALLFHDVIYRPESKNNEINSIQFMLNLLDGTAIPDKLKNQAAMAIQTTAMHLEESIDPDFNKVLDLDLCGFSFEKVSYETINNCIEKEFTQENTQRYGGISKKDYLKGRKEFLNQLNNKKSIYRTEEFLNRFEKLAKNNVLKSLNELNNI